MMKGRLFCLLFSVLLLSSGGASASDAEPSLDECRAAPARAVCTGPILDRMLALIDAKPQPDRGQLRAALAQRLIDNDQLVGAFRVARGLANDARRDAMLSVVGTMHANLRDYAEAQEIAALIGNPRARIAVYKAQTQRIVLDGEVEPALQFVRQVDDADLTDSFQESLVTLFISEGRFDLARENALEIADARRRNDALYRLATAQFKVVPLAEVMLTMGEVDDPSARAQGFAFLGSDAQTSGESAAADRFFGESERALDVLAAAAGRDADRIREILARQLEMSERAGEALTVAEGIGDLERRLPALARIAGTLAKLGGRERAKNVFEANLAAADGIDDPQQRYTALARQAEQMLSAGFEEAALALLDAIGDAERRDEAHRVLGQTALMANRFDLAERIVGDNRSPWHRVVGQLAIASGLSIVESERVRAVRLADAAEASLKRGEVEASERVMGDLIGARLQLRQFEQARGLIDGLPDAVARFRQLIALIEAATRAGEADIVRQASADTLALLAAADTEQGYRRIARAAQVLARAGTPADLLADAGRLGDPAKARLFLTVVALRLVETGRLADAQWLVRQADDRDLSEEFRLIELMGLLLTSLGAE